MQCATVPARLTIARDCMRIQFPMNREIKDLRVWDFDDTQ
jgi:hypothetical protein